MIYFTNRKYVLKYTSRSSFDKNSNLFSNLNYNSLIQCIWCKIHFKNKKLFVLFSFNLHVLFFVLLVFSCSTFIVFYTDLFLKIKFMRYKKNLTNLAWDSDKVWTWMIHRDCLSYLHTNILQSWNSTLFEVKLSPILIFSITRKDSGISISLFIFYKRWLHL